MAARIARDIESKRFKAAHRARQCQSPVHRTRVGIRRTRAWIWAYIGDHFRRACSTPSWAGSSSTRLSASTPATAKRAAFRAQARDQCVGADTLVTAPLPARSTAIGAVASRMTCARGFSKSMCRSARCRRSCASRRALRRITSSPAAPSRMSIGKPWRTTRSIGSAGAGGVLLERPRHELRRSASLRNVIPVKHPTQCGENEQRPGNNQPKPAYLSSAPRCDACPAAARPDFRFRERAQVPA